MILTLVLIFVTACLFRYYGYNECINDLKETGLLPKDFGE